jgi:hypothetical protein
MKSLKKSLCLLLANTVLLAGCAGRQANPIPAYLPGDENRSCPALQAEIAQLQADMQRIMPDTNKFGYNAVCATAGFFLIVPFFFMDMKDAEKIEWEAMRTRHNRLLVYAAEKGCDFGGKGVPDRILSPEEAKKLSKETKKQQADSKNNQSLKEQNAPITSGLTVINCENCGHEIGKLEKAYVYEGHVVCSQCFSKLKQQP